MFGYARHMELVSFPGGKCILYRLYLTDKKGTHFSLEDPSQYLSSRAIQRRINQRIAIDSTDLPVSIPYLAALKQYGIEIVGKSKWNNTVLVRLSSEKKTKIFRELPFVKGFKKVFEAPDSVKESVRSRFHKELSQWHAMSNDYGTTEKQIKNLNGINLHNQGYRGDGKMIAVFDGGFMNVDRISAFHDINMVGYADFVYPKSSNIFQEMEHGTMVLSVLAINSPSYYVGTAPNASYVLVRCEDDRTESPAEEDYWTEAAEYADSLGVDVINSSLGYHEFDDKTMNYSYDDQDGHTAMISRTASMLADKGIVLVNSAGNEGMGTWKKINFPADADNILTVGAINDKGVNAPFSSIGPTADGRIKPDVMAYGSPVSVISGRGTIINDIGTSFSAPLVAGMVACLWEALPDFTAKQIIELVKESSNRYSNPNNIYGYGVPDFWKAYQKGQKLTK